MLSLTQSIRQSCFSMLAVGTVLGLGLLAPRTSQAWPDDVDAPAIECEQPDLSPYVPTLDPIDEPSDCMGLCMSDLGAPAQTRLNQLPRRRGP
jgi:hypothetical protein